MCIMMHYLMFIMVHILCTTGITSFIRINGDRRSHHPDTRIKPGRHTLVDSSISVVHELE